MNIIKILILFFAYFCTTVYSQVVHNIKAQIVIKPERDDIYHWKELLSHTNELANLGLTFVDSEPDVLLCNWVTKELLQTNIPIIILEINAAASLKNKTRKYLKYPQVKAVFKNRLLRDKNTYNAPHVQQTYFFSLVNDYAHLSDPRNYTPLSNALLDKIKLVIWDFNWSPFNKSKFSSLVFDHNINKEKPLDLFFAGRLLCNGKSMLQQFYNWHRTKAFEALHALSGVTCEIIEGRALPFAEYVEKTAQSKIIVSPWGWGEWCYRDFEAILNNAVLIKPDTSFVLSYPDIYQNYKTYVPCKPDFSDLEEKVHSILSNMNYYKTLTEKAKKNVIKSWQQYDQLLPRFVDAIANALKDE